MVRTVALLVAVLGLVLGTATSWADEAKEDFHEDRTSEEIERSVIVTLLMGYYTQSM